MLLLMVKKRCFCSFWLKCAKIIIGDGSKVEEKHRGCSIFLGRLADALDFSGDAPETSYGFGGSNFKSSSAFYIRCGQPLEPFEDIIFGDIRHRA